MMEINNSNGTLQYVCKAGRVGLNSNSQHQHKKIIVIKNNNKNNNFNTTVHHERQTACLDVRLNAYLRSIKVLTKLASLRKT